MSGGWGGMLVSFWQDWQEYVKVKIQSDAQKQSVKDSVMRFLAEDSFKLFVHVFKFFQYCFTQCFNIFSLFPARVSISGFGGRNFLLIDRNSTQPGTLGTAVHRVKSCVTHCGWSLLVSSNLFLQSLQLFSEDSLRGTSVVPCTLVAQLHRLHGVLKL